MYDNELYHFGIKGQKWGIRRYQNPDGSLTELGKQKYGTKKNFEEHQNKVKARNKKIAKTVAVGAGTSAAAAGAAIAAKHIMGAKLASMAVPAVAPAVAKTKTHSALKVIGALTVGGFAAKNLTKYALAYTFYGKAGLKKSAPLVTAGVHAVKGAARGVKGAARGAGDAVRLKLGMPKKGYDSYENYMKYMNKLKAQRSRF